MSLPPATAPRWKLALGPLLAVSAYAGAHLGGLEHEAALTLAITLGCAAWWMTDAVAHAITALCRRSAPACRPSAVAFASGPVNGTQTLRYGTMLDLLAVLVVSLASLWLLH